MATARLREDPDGATTANLVQRIPRRNLLICAAKSVCASTVRLACCFPLNRDYMATRTDLADGYARSSAIHMFRATYMSSLTLSYGQASPKLLDV